MAKAKTRSWVIKIRAKTNDASPDVTADDVAQTIKSLLADDWFLRQGLVVEAREVKG
jgi:hypothetical protein